jgi:chemotaxis protein MotB
MARKHLLSLAAFGMLMAGGCVSQEKYTALKLDRDRYAEQLGQAQNEASAARSEADAYKNQLSSIGNTAGSKDAMVLNLTNENAELKRQMDEINRKYADAVNKVGTGTALPPALTNELSAFAQQNPQLVDFDEKRGIVKFKSDLTFAPGSAELTPQAKQAIGRFAQILNSPSANGYELMVAGHTDNTNVVNQQTVAAGHKNNWYLSAHRAISVSSELTSQHIDPQRLAVTGYADQRPVASNASEAGKQQNRRVEVLILPTQVRSKSPIAATVQPAATKKQAAPAAAPKNKDGGPRIANNPTEQTSVPQPTTPALNK